MVAWLTVPPIVRARVHSAQTPTVNSRDKAVDILNGLTEGIPIELNNDPHQVTVGQYDNRNHQVIMDMSELPSQHPIYFAGSARDVSIGAKEHKYAHEAVRLGRWLV
jgi:hypothetical protein